MELKRSIGRGVVFLSLNIVVVSLVVPLLLTPYLKVRLGNDELGTWMLISQVGMLFHLMDLGLSNSVIRFVSLYRETGQTEALRRLVASCVWVYLVLGILAIAIGVALGPTLFALLVGGNPERGRILFGLLGAAFLFGVLAKFFGYCVNGTNHVATASLIGTVFGGVTLVSAVVPVEMGYGLEGLLVAGIGVQFLFAASFAIAASIYGVPLSVRPSDIRVRELGQLLIFGMKLQGAYTVDTLAQCDRMYLAFAGGLPKDVALYGIGAALPQRIRNGVSFLSFAVLPAASALDARKDEARMAALIDRGAKYHALIGWYMAAFTAVFAVPLLTLWIGEAPAESVVVMRIMALGGLASCLMSVFVSVGAAVGRPGMQVISSGVGLIVGIAVFCVLHVQRGPLHVSIASAVSAAMIASTLLYFVLFHTRVRRLRIGSLVLDLLVRPILALLPATIVLYVIPTASAGRIEALGVCTGGVLASGILYLLACRAIRALDSYDLEFIRGLFRRSSS